MKKPYVLLLILLLAASGFAQEVIRNPAKPSNPGAGRVLKLELVYEISDASGEFFFKFPRYFYIDDQKRLYFLDEDELLQFSPEGKFIRNFFKKGQGPGEISADWSSVSFAFDSKELYVCDGIGKIIRFREDGTLAGEIRLSEGKRSRLFGIDKKGFLIYQEKGIRFKQKSGLQEMGTRILLFSPDGTRTTSFLEFPWLFYMSANYGKIWDVYLQAFNPRDNSLYVSHTGEYRVVKVDLSQNKIVRSFSREYPRVKHIVRDYEKEIIKKYHPPVKDFENDIENLFLCGDNLWVETSTYDKEERNLFDVFDPLGRFIDSFHINRSVHLILVDGDFIFAVTKDKEGNLLIGKYRVLNGTKF